MVASNSFHRKVQKLEDARYLLNATALREEHSDAVDRRRRRAEIARSAHIDDAALVERLVDAGLDAETLPAIQLAPLALVAWASGSVSEDENRTVAQSIAESELAQNPAAIACFEHWLSRRPDCDLLLLWTEVQRNASTIEPPAMQQARLRRLHHLATRIAMASGGVLGFGRICVAEQAVLDAIDHEIQRVTAASRLAPIHSIAKLPLAVTPPATTS